MGYEVDKYQAEGFDQVESNKHFWKIQKRLLSIDLKLLCAILQNLKWRFLISTICRTVQQLNFFNSAPISRMHVDLYCPWLVPYGQVPALI
jgi:hypothetical protein